MCVCVGGGGGGDTLSSTVILLVRLNSNCMERDDARSQTHIIFGSGKLPLEGSGEVEGMSWGVHFPVRENVVQPVSTRYTLAICKGLVECALNKITIDDYFKQLKLQFNCFSAIATN